ncbi:SURF1 family protein [Woodsholea maritima]|uniref:SURF1 family protein n=1 Tax=Woodsholea maritima TaxID=240237 RepID=UPI000373B238|nr:SURF1 family protein [Woodsholea maritima]
MSFRPYPVLTLCLIPALALLLGLGVWQVQRMGWKSDLIARFEAMRAEPAQDLETALCAPNLDSGRPLLVEPPRLEERRAVKVWGRGPQNVAGWRVFKPMSAPACLGAAAILIETGFEPFLAEEAVSFTAQPAYRFATGLQVGPFTPEANLAERTFYAFQPLAMAQALNLPGSALAPQGWIELDNGSLPEFLTQTPPERHFGYALTWFLMALALVVVYGVYHVQSGRLIFTRKKE